MRTKTPVLKAPLGVGISLKLGITGGIGSGKSTVANLFQLLGVPVYNADDAAKKLMNESPVIRQKLVEAFGAHTYNENGLNRPWLAEKVFSNPEKLQQLNSIVHPIVIQYGKDLMAVQEGPLVMKEAAIFFESGSAAGLDYIIGVYAPEELRIQRVIQRDGSTRQEVQSRMARQINEEVKMKLCDFVIVNDDTRLVIPQVLELHHTLLGIALG